ncbi:helix-turn-helix transcriptional regulator [Marinagarivorans cellulosilyticus]|uniref:DNA-binding protein n=1 Tax=Marinagarivorans cellulosilyticus TaxID=2721545 RepID=A0AAN1WJN8_9GAMM|nr:DNA-binding protein [Marinagarivorans cellulosilyticus]BCD98845.1 hypothetical protein MARGE09_P3046 [Marinagarivorans cellulosilyticus]
MNEYEFTLIYSLPDNDADPDQYIEQLAEAGCDDALIGVGRRGRIALDFIREDKSAALAIVSALKQVKSVIPEARLIEATPDYVGLTEVADIIGCSRQNMRKLTQNHALSFPVPIHEGKAAIWHLFPVLDWFKQRESYKIDSRLIEVSKTAMEINAAKQLVSIQSPVENYTQLV